jgi:ketosteroid isomerase-like protein
MDELRFAHIAELFQRGWYAPGPGAWDDLLTEDVELVQPMIPPTRGRAAWDAQILDVLRLVPDLHGTVQHWSGHGNTLFIELALEGTLGGKPVSWGLVDVLTLEGDRCRKRVSYFDSAPLALAILRRPRAWRAAAKLPKARIASAMPGPGLKQRTTCSGS